MSKRTLDGKIRMRAAKAAKLPPPKVVETKSAEMFQLVEHLDRDVTDAIKSKKLVLRRGDIRFLVDLYYAQQEMRKRTANQERSAAEEEPNAIVHYIFTQHQVIEKQLVKVLDAWTDTDKLSAWAKSQKGIGPVIAAGLAAHIDMKIPKSAGAIWRFAGLAPPLTYEWKKGMKRPWNARLKVLCWKIGDSFVKLGASSDSRYAKFYRARKALEVQHNEDGAFKVEAARTLEAKNIKDKETRAKYEAGRFPDGRLDLRARRYAVKLFLAHYFETGWRILYGTEPPMPYPIQHLGHVKWIRADSVE